MGQFVKWVGSGLPGPSIHNSFQHAKAGEPFKFGFAGMVPGITVRINNESVATLAPGPLAERHPAGVNEAINWYQLIGLSAGTIWVEARFSDGNVWSFFQLVVPAQPGAGSSNLRMMAYDAAVDLSQIKAPGAAAPTGWNADIALTMNLVFDPINTATCQEPGAGNRMFNCRPWTPGALASFSQKVKTSVERHWSLKFWLKPPPQVNELVVGGYLANLHCNLRINIGHSPPHFRIPVVRATTLTDGKPADFGSDSLEFEEGNADTLAYHHPYNLPTTPIAYSVPSTFNGIWHEVGHLLGLPHPFEGQPIHPGEAGDVYVRVAISSDGIPAGVLPDSYSTMGVGTELRPAYAAPWQNAAAAWFNRKSPGRNLRASDFVPSLTRLVPERV